MENASGRSTSSQANRALQAADLAVDAAPLIPKQQAERGVGVGGAHPREILRGHEVAVGGVALGVDEAVDAGEPRVIQQVAGRHQAVAAPHHGVVRALGVGPGLPENAQSAPLRRVVVGDVGDGGQRGRLADYVSPICDTGTAIRRYVSLKNNIVVV